MKLDPTDVIKSLQPAPSVSRTGKMADLATSIDNLARSGAAAFTTVRTKQPRLGIIVAEVVNGSLLDPFGTSVPKQDGGRHNELVSSPREHPQLTAKYNTLRNAEKNMAFRKSVNTQKGSAEDAAAAARSDHEDRMEKHRRMFIMDDDDTPSTRRAPTPPTSNFRTVPRDKIKPQGNLETPPVGHYRPRFSLLETRPPAVSLKGQDRGLTDTPIKPTKRPNSTDPKSSSFDSPDASVAPDPHHSVPDLGMSEVVEGAAKTAPEAAAVSEERAVKTMSTPETRGSSMFVSRVKNRPEQKSETPDKFYWPYNEACVSGKHRVRGYVEFDRQTDRKRQLIRGVEPGNAPDVVYDIPSRSSSRASTVAFDKQLPRQLGGPSHPKYAADHMHYDTDLLLKKTIPGPDFARLTSREQTPTEIQRAKAVMVPTVEYTLKDTERVGPRRVPCTVKFDKQTGRKAQAANVCHDLTYDARFDAVQRRSPIPHLDHGKGHGDFFQSSLTADCDYDPQDGVTRPAGSPARDMRKVTSRAAYAGTRQMQAASLDRFYDTDTEWTRPRIMGNPMLRSHMSREDRNVATRRRTVSPDTFYDYNVDTVLPKHAKGLVDFSKSITRGQRAPPRTHNPSSPEVPPRARSTSPRRLRAT